MENSSRPWYREIWPWILMTGPAVVVVAGLVTAWIAYKYADPLVTEDYYRKGLQAGHTLAGSERALALGLVAELHFQADKIAVRLSGSDDFKPPSSVRVTLSHPTRAGLDQTMTATLANGSYRLDWRAAQTGHWIVLIEDDLQSWRMVGKVLLPLDMPVSLHARP